MHRLSYKPLALMLGMKVCIVSLQPLKSVHRDGYYGACDEQERIRQKEAYNVFTKENPTIVGISEFALRPVIREQDPDIRANALQKIGMGNKVQ